VNDFLYNLASRVVSVDDDIRPRLPSVFEPVASASGPVFAASDEDFNVEFPSVATDHEASEKPPALDSSLTQSRKTEASFRASEHSYSETIIDRSSVPGEQQGEAEPGNRASLSNENRADTPTRHLAPAPEGILARPTSVTRKEEVASLGSNRPVPKLIPERSRPSSPDGDNPSADIKSQFTETLETDAFYARIRRESVLPPHGVDRIRSEGDGRNGTVPLVNPAQPQPVLPAGPGQTEPPWQRQRIIAEPTITENVINVTIGRIEVRAASPPPAKSKSGSHAPAVTSLDDYLRQRTRTDRGGGV
jgi:hypothetical protein